MDELGLDVQQVLSWFSHVQNAPYVLIRVSEEHARSWADALAVAFRRCYITDTMLEERAVKHGVPKAEILSAKLPDPGATMAGDFGEILVFLYHAAKQHPHVVVGPKKWGLREDRRRPAAHFDVIQFVLASWPTPSEHDVLLCSEVKTKSTNSRHWRPIRAAIRDITKNRTSRLARTLVWLKEKALVEDLGNVTLEHLERFINATDHPPAIKRFHAVAVVCAGLLDGELADAPTETPTDYRVLVIVVPDLHRTYTAVFDAVRQSVLTADEPSHAGGTL